MKVQANIFHFNILLDSAVKSQRTKNCLSNFENNINLLNIDEKGITQNPYQYLPSIDILEKAEKINEGTGAMRAYEDMVFGINKNNPEIKKLYSLYLHLIVIYYYS